MIMGGRHDPQCPTDIPAVTVTQETSGFRALFFFSLKHDAWEPLVWHAVTVFPISRVCAVGRVPREKRSRDKRDRRGHAATIHIHWYTVRVYRNVYVYVFIYIYMYVCAHVRDSEDYWKCANEYIYIYICINGRASTDVVQVAAAAAAADEGLCRDTALMDGKLQPAIRLQPTGKSLWGVSDMPPCRAYQSTTTAAAAGTNYFINIFIRTPLNGSLRRRPCHSSPTFRK